MWKNVSYEHISSVFKVENHPKPSNLLQSGFLRGWFSTLKLEITNSPETPIHVRTTTRRHEYISEYHNIHSLRSENLKSM
jgi:hypothetical protein